MATGIGAAWAHGGLPPWMQQPPWFDESVAADLHDERLAVDLLAERFGPPADLAAERDRLPRPPELAELVELANARRSTPVDYAHRRAVLDAALHTTDHPTVDYDRRAA